MCPNSGGAGTCDAQTKCFYVKNMSEQATSLYAACRANPSCKGDDGCVREAGIAIGGAAATKYETDCVAKAQSCNSVVDGDLCGASLYAYKGDKAAVEACLAKPCAEVSTCIKATLLFTEFAKCKTL
jgi:hypothetical protein